MLEPKPYHQKLEVRDFTCFHQADFEFGGGVNVFVGENGTGKTHTLKLLYALQRRQYEREDAILPKTLREVFNTLSIDGLIRFPFRMIRLDGVYGETTWNANLEDFRPLERREEFVSQIVSQRPDLDVESASELEHLLRSQADPILVTSSRSRWSDVGRPVFIPTQDILGHYRRFVSLYDTYKIDFDSTYRDLATLLGAPEKRELNDYQTEMLAVIRKLVGGEFALKGDGFVLDHGQGEYEAALIGEGHRKLGALALLIRNGMLEPGGALFWDEPEANVNPTSMDEIVTVLLTLARHGVQIFLSTHSYVILKELDLQATAGDGVRYFAFGKSEEGTVVTSSTDFTELSPNPILDQYDSLFSRDIEKSLQEANP